VGITYSGCTPVCELASALQELPDFDGGGRAVDKVFANFPAQKWQEKSQRTVLFQRSADNVWSISTIQ
jgi:hypothetical protein